MLFRVVGAARLRVGKGTAGQVVDLMVQGAQQPFDMASVVRPRHWAPVQGDVILLAGLPKHVATELFGIICMDAVHHTPDGPRRGDLVLGQPTLFGQDGVRQA